MTAANSPCIDCRMLVRKYGTGTAQVLALDHVSLQVPAGQIVALSGPSGSGKSTLLHLIGAMDRPDEGQVFVAETDLATLNDERAARFRRERLGFVFQFFNLIPTLSALDNVSLPARLAGTPGKHAHASASALLESLGLSSKKLAYPDALSGGQQQRVAVARALINRPAIILADEPTGALDRNSGNEVLQLLTGLVRKENATLLMATHSDEVRALADRVVAIEDGRIVSDTLN